MHNGKRNMTCWYVVEVEEVKSPLDLYSIRTSGAICWKNAHLAFIAYSNQEQFVRKREGTTTICNFSYFPVLKSNMAILFCCETKSSSILYPKLGHWWTWTATAGTFHFELYYPWFSERIPSNSEWNLIDYTMRERERLTAEIMGIQCDPHDLEKLTEFNSPTVSWIHTP
jgi:hypothetical protein